MRILKSLKRPNSEPKVVIQEIGDSINLVFTTCIRIDRSAAVKVISRSEFIFLLLFIVVYAAGSIMLLNGKFEHHSLIFIFTSVLAGLALVLLVFVLWFWINCGSWIGNAKTRLFGFYLAWRTISLTGLLALNIGILYMTTLDYVKLYGDKGWGSMQGVGMCVYVGFALVFVFMLLLEILYWTYYVNVIVREEIEMVEDRKVHYAI